jgi:group I intron endonuclease
MRYFIYQITNLKNNRFYIGQHRCDGEFLDSNYYGSGTAIVRAVKKHGIQNFKREVLVECTSEAALNFMESVYVGMELVNDKSKAKMSASGKGKQSRLGKSHSEESKAKMSASAKGKTGKTHSDESKAKMSAARKAYHAKKRGE